MHGTVALSKTGRKVVQGETFKKESYKKKNTNEALRIYQGNISKKNSVT